ncbi:MAG TPA: hypothetical protein VNR38_23840 [Ureibacillus sp.]|uniref:hypothetical protein n=1 Tax=Peribacillus asahii TaxID=228899 RepID=UPI00207AB7EB|nr:hypothetical protein [Peribacillus asahii]USK61767.1 hypothetical protein LIT37_10860 [Peribacillus asahii]HWL26744.1 hypothetical protein [Ureibacillus sp.]
MLKIKIISAFFSLIAGNVMIYLVLIGKELVNHNTDYSESDGIGFVMSVIIYASVLFVLLYGIPISYAIDYFTRRITKAKWVYSLLCHILFGILGPLLFGFLQDPLDFLSSFNHIDSVWMCFAGAYFAGLFAIGQQLIYRMTKKES